VGSWSAPFFFARGTAGFANPAEDFTQARLGGALPAELLVELPIGGDQGRGATDDEGDLVGAVAFLGQEDDAGEGGHIVFNGAQGMVQGPGDLLGFLALEEEADRLDAVRLTGADVLLLAAAGDREAAAAEGGHVADDGAQAAVE